MFEGIERGREGGREGGKEGGRECLIGIYNHRAHNEVLQVSDFCTHL